ncbi:MAG: hypothetical protein K8U57_18980 [Planctomycetes bacterium]|nr:hypothetical protein [Planctomycetota bacterium]
MTDDEFLAAFEAVAISRSEWTHEAHVRMAWLYLTQFPTDEALDRIRSGIQNLNARNGVLDGYHETITVAFVRIIVARLLHNETYEVFRQHNPELFDRTLGVLLAHYTHKRLFSSEARARFVEPDVQSLPSFAPKPYCR